MVRPSGKQLLIRTCCARRLYRVMLHNCFSRCSRPIGMKKLSYKNRCKLACHAHVSTLFTGHKQRFIHTHVTRSPPIGIAKLSEVFMNINYNFSSVQFFLEYFFHIHHTNYTIHVYVYLIQVRYSNTIFNHKL